MVLSDAGQCALSSDAPVLFVKFLLGETFFRSTIIFRPITEFSYQICKNVMPEASVTVYTSVRLTSWCPEVEEHQ